MEYYNSLLESYDLLKKRKFKLSLAEARGPIVKPGEGGPKERPGGATSKREDPARGPAAEAAGQFLNTVQPGAKESHGSVTATGKDDGSVTVDGLPGGFGRGTFIKSGGGWVDGKGTALEGAEVKSTAGKLVSVFMLSLIHI